MKTAAWILDGLALIPFLCGIGCLLLAAQKGRASGDRTADVSATGAMWACALALVYIAYWLRLL